MAIIPQDAFLFDDSLLRNLDPKDSYTSVEVNDVIEKCHLTKVVQELGKMKEIFSLQNKSRVYERNCQFTKEIVSLRKKLSVYERNCQFC